MKKQANKKVKKAGTNNSKHRRSSALKLVFLLVLIQANSSITLPVTHTQTGKRFKSINNFGMEDTNLYSIATTDNGEVYSITKTITSPTQYTFEAKDSTASYPHQILNAIHLNKDYVFTLVQHSTTSKVHYQLFKAKVSGTVDLKADSQASSFAEAQSSAAADIVNNHIEILPIGGTRLYMIAIANTGVEILRYNLDQNEILPYTGTPGYFLSTEKVLKTAFCFDARSSMISVAYSTTHTSPAEERIYDTHLQTTKLDYSAGLTLPTPSSASFRTKGIKSNFAHHGIRYGLNGNGKEGTIDTENIVFYMKNGASYHEFSLLKFSHGQTTIDYSVPDTSSPFSTYQVCGIVVFKGTRFWGVLYSEGNQLCYSHGSGISPYSFFYVVRHEFKYMGEGGMELTYVKSANTRSYRLSDLGVVDSAGHGLFVGDWSDQPNIMYIESVGTFGCAPGQAMKPTSPTAYSCGAENSGFPLCKKFQGYSHSCDECNDPSGGTTYSRTETHQYNIQNHFYCHPSTLSCDNSAGKYVDADSNSCYDCATAFPGCTKCVNYLKSCQYDSCADTHTFYLDSNQVGKCKTKCTVNNCQVCDDISGNDKCYICKPLFYLASQTSCVSCTNAGAHCKRCFRSNVCEECEAGYYLTATSSFTTRTCTRCPDENKSMGTFCASCTFSTSNPGCNDCVLGTQDSCTGCHEGYLLDIGTKKCNLGCPQGKYLDQSGAYPACPTCVSVDTASSPSGSGNPNCDQCTDGTGVCTQCKAGFKLDSRKYCRPNSCSANEFWHLDQRACTACTAGPHWTNKCAGSTCEDETGFCLSCISGYSLIDNFCQIDCNPDQYWKGKTNNVCESCTNPASNIANPKCERCNSINGECMRCMSGYSLDTTTNFCRKDCNPDQYWKGKTNNVCESCTTPTTNIANPNCHTCSDLNGACTTCQAGFSLHSSTNFCRKDCSSSQYWKSTEENSCAECSGKTKNCIECEDQSGKCSKCDAGYILNQKNGSCTFPSEDRILMNNIIFSKKKESLILDFSMKPVIKDPDSFTIVLREKDQQSPTPLQFDPPEVEGKKVIFKLTIPKEGIENGTVTINSTTFPNIASTSSQDNIFLEFPQEVSGISIFVSAAAQAAATTAGSSLSKVMLLQNIILTVISIPIAILIIQLFQIIDFIGLININLPANAQAFIEYFDQNILTVFKNPLVFDEDITRCQVHQVFVEYDISCITFNNMGIFLVELIVFLVIRLILQILLVLTSCCLLKKGGSINQLSKNKNKRTFSQTVLLGIKAVRDLFSIEFFSMFLIGCELDALMGAFTGLRYGEQENRETSVNYILACVEVFCYLVYFVFLLGLAIKVYREAPKRQKKEKEERLKLKKQEMEVENSPFETPDRVSLQADRRDQIKIESQNKIEEEKEKGEKEEEKEKGEKKEQKEEKEDESRWDFFFEEIKQENPLTVFIVPLMMFQELVMPPIIIFNVKSPEWQIIPLALIYGVVFTFMLIKRQFKSILENSLTSINCGFYLLTLMCLWFLSTTSGQKMLEKDRYNYIGNSMIALISLAVLSNAVIAFVPIFIGIKDLICKKKENQKERVKNGVTVVDKIGNANMLNDHELNRFQKKNNKKSNLGGLFAKNKDPAQGVSKITGRSDQKMEMDKTIKDDDKTVGFRGQMEENSAKDKESEAFDLNQEDPFDMEQKPPERKLKKVKSSPDLGADLENMDKMEIKNGNRGTKDEVIDRWNLNLDEEDGLNKEAKIGLGLKNHTKEADEHRRGDISLVSKSKKPIKMKFNGPGLRPKRGQIVQSRRPMNMNEGPIKNKSIKKNPGLPGQQEEDPGMDIWDFDE